MKFKLRTSGYFYFVEGKEHLEKLGFKFNSEKYKERYTIIDSYPEIELNTLDDLLNLYDNYGELIIRGNIIEIYDDYRE